MNQALRQALDAHGGAMHRRDLLAVIPHHVIDWALASGVLLNPYPSVYLDARRSEEEQVRLRAALRYAGRASALSHVSGLRQWQLPVPAAYRAVHVATSASSTARGRGPLRVHRWSGFAAPGLVVVRDGLRVVNLERCLVDAWPALPAGPERRAPTITAIRERRTTAARVFTALEGVPKLRDRATLRHLLTLIGRGCHSELEIWGHDHVFDIPPFASATRQLPMTLPTGRIYLDVAIEDVMVDFELDGRTYHSSPEQREQDMRRDAAVAAMGWLPIRFSHRRLTREPELVRREAVAIVTMRRNQLRAAA